MIPPVVSADREVELSDSDRVLDALLHDLRSPLGAATGYLRLIREKRITPGPDLDRAIEQTQAALRNISALCARAETLRLQPSSRAVSEPLSRACEEIVRRLDGQMIHVECDDLPASAVIMLMTDWADLCPAMTAMLALVARPRPNGPAGSVRVSTMPTHVRLAVQLAPRQDALKRSAFDPWAYPGMVVALGCRAIERAGGRWEAPPDEAVLRVEFPLAS